MNTKSSKQINNEFYEDSYASQGLLKILLKQFMSYDQLSKTRQNLVLASNVIDTSECLNVLDYGFGYGTFLLRIPRQHKAFGCELSEQAIGNLKKISSFLFRKIYLCSADGINRTKLFVRFCMLFSCY